MDKILHDIVAVMLARCPFIDISHWYDYSIDKYCKIMHPNDGHAILLTMYSSKSSALISVGTHGGGVTTINVGKSYYIRRRLHYKLNHVGVLAYLNTTDNEN